MTGRVMIVTGASSGLGFEVAKYLAEGGNDVVLACRNSEDGDEAVTRIKQLFPNSLVQLMQLDLSSTTSVREFVKEFTRKKKKLSVLINNAAIALNPKDLTPRSTKDGFELTMATNYFGPFLLTNLLIDYLVQTGSILGDSRIINVSCSVHDHENNCSTRHLDYLDADNLQLENAGTYNGLQAYKNSKLCNILFTYHLAEKMRGKHVFVNAVDPGYVPETGLQRHYPQANRFLAVCCLHNMLRCCKITKTIRQAATQIVNLATSEKYEGETGKYYCDGIEDRSSPESYDRDLQKTVWTISQKLIRCRSSEVDDFDDISLGQ